MTADSSTPNRNVACIRCLTTVRRRQSRIRSENPDEFAGMMLPPPTGCFRQQVFATLKLAEVASAGVNRYIVETHSDHVLNGIRRAVKNEDVEIPDAVALHFFRPRRGDERERTAQVQSPVLDSDGNIDTWPDGFFDQFDKDMNYFAGWS